MILVLIGAAALGIGIGCAVYQDRKDGYVEGWSAATIVGGAIMFGIMLTTMAVQGVFMTEPYISKYQQKQAGLEYRCENAMYDEKMNLLDATLVQDVSKWNQDVAFGKAAKDNIWIGVFYPSAIYDSVDVIDFASIRNS